jgi:hypothetical protein
MWRLVRRRKIFHALLEAFWKGDACEMSDASLCGSRYEKARREVIIKSAAILNARLLSRESTCEAAKSSVAIVSRSAATPTVPSHRVGIRVRLTRWLRLAAAGWHARRPAQLRGERSATVLRAPQAIAQGTRSNYDAMCLSVKQEVAQQCSQM